MCAFSVFYKLEVKEMIFLRAAALFSDRDVKRGAMMEIPEFIRDMLPVRISKIEM